MEVQIRDNKTLSKSTPSASSPAQSADEQDTDDVWMDSEEEEDLEALDQSRSSKSYCSSERAIAEQEWQKLHTNFGNEGYREGLNDGKQRVLQENFDLGYAEGVPVGRSLGRLLATLEALSITNDLSDSTLIPHPDDVSQLSQLIRSIQALDVKSLFGPRFQERMNKATASTNPSPEAQICALEEEAKSLIHRLGLKVPN